MIVKNGRRLAKNGNTHSIGLADQARMWATPKASDANGTGKAGSKSAIHDALRRNLRGEVAMFPTPTTGAGMCGGTGNYQQLKSLEAGG